MLTNLMNKMDVFIDSLSDSQYKEVNEKINQVKESIIGNLDQEDPSVSGKMKEIIENKELEEEDVTIFTSKLTSIFHSFVPDLYQSTSQWTNEQHQKFQETMSNQLSGLCENVKQIVPDYKESFEKMKSELTNFIWEEEKEDE